jgi:hypothetical protein
MDIQFYANKLTQASNITYNTLTGGYIIYNTLTGGGINYNTLTGGGINYNTLANTILNTSASAFVLSGTIASCDMKDADTSSIDFTAATIILNQSVSKILFKRLDGAARMRYVNNSDAWVITTINA